MRCPRKLYLVVSRRAKTKPAAEDVELSYGNAEVKRAVRNADKYLKQTDWRVETYVKGD